MNKILEIAHPGLQFKLRHFKLTKLRGLAQDNTLEKLVPLENLPERYQISTAFIWDCLLALKIEPQKLEEQIYFSTQNLKRLEQFMKRVEISWACPHILETCYRETKKS